MSKKDKLYSLSRVKGTSDENMDSVKAHSGGGEYKRAMDVLMDARVHWENMHRFRKERRRCKRYAYGEQWLDKITVDGKTMSEEDYLIEQGSVPLKNNLIRRLIRNVIGVYSKQEKEPTCIARDRDEQKLGETMSTVLQCNMQVNRTKELNSRSMEEFLISGLVAYRKWYGWRNDKLDCWTDIVQPESFFVDGSSRDVRGWDINIIGEIHDLSFKALAQTFAKRPEDFRKLRDIYSREAISDRFTTAFYQFGYSMPSNMDFFTPRDPNMCRVIEVWRKECKPRYCCHDQNSGEIFKVEVEDYEDMVVKENEDRIRRGREFGKEEDDIPTIRAEWFIDSYWYYYFLTPYGDILDEGETPYEHKSHPYVVKAYPFIDGEIHSFVSDVIDQQRYVNRLISIYDMILRSSAKGVLMFPEECKPENMSIEEIAEEYTKYNGMIFYKAKPGISAPHQISANSTNIGIGDLLGMQLRFFEDISGIHGALQGKPGNAGMSASLYSQQTQNATNSLVDILDSFSSFLVDSAYKDIKNIQQFYDHRRVVNIAGRGGNIIEYDPSKIRDVEFDLSITESTTTPAYRQIANDFLLEIWRSGQITLKQLLEQGDFPFSDDLLQSLQSQEEDLKKQQEEYAKIQESAL